jgi:hypothetical protein
MPAEAERAIHDNLPGLRREHFKDGLQKDWDVARVMLHFAPSYTPVRPARLAMTATSSAGSTGFARCD